MATLEFVTPAQIHEQAALEYRQEHIDQGETVLHGGSLFDQIENYSDWLKHLAVVQNPETLPDGWVTSNTYFAVREHDGRIVGMVNIRHELNYFLRNYGGHIGYGVRPSERRKGYATRILWMALEYCRSLGLEKVMLGCNKENEASRRTILTCGGKLDREFLHTDGKFVQVFWIAL